MKRDAPQTVAPDTAFALARFAAQLRYDGVPPQVVATTKRFVLDAIGVALAGSTAPGSAETCEVYRSWGGRPEATVFARAARLAAPQAALVNAVMLHARDFDDTHDVAIVHAYASVLPSALATAEAEGNVDGRRLLTAIVAGVEIACRLGLALRHYHGWHNSAVCGVFGAAAAAGRILLLPEERMRHAIGIAFSQAAGNVQCIRDGALTKRMQLGFAAQAGVSAAYLARAGITGATHTFDGSYGFLRLYDHEASMASGTLRLRDDGGRYGAHELTADLGARFEGANLSMKPYPNSRAVHPAIAAALALRTQMTLHAADISRVVVTVSERTFERVGARYRPDSDAGHVQAQFNLCYGVAVALCRGRVGLADFEPDHLEDAEVLALAEKIQVARDSSFRENLPVTVAVDTLDGRQAQHTETTLEGAPDAPMSSMLCEQKFRQCCEVAARRFAPAEQDAVIDTIDKLEAVQDVRVLAKLLA